MKTTDDLLDMLARLPTQEGYSAMDRYRDFRKVFDTTEGGRVLREILAWGRMFGPPVLGRPIDPYAMAVAFGERNIALKLLSTIHNEPPDKPQKQRKNV